MGLGQSVIGNLYFIESMDLLIILDSFLETGYDLFREIPWILMTCPSSMFTLGVIHVT